MIEHHLGDDSEHRVGSSPRAVQWEEWEPTPRWRRIWRSVGLSIRDVRRYHIRFQWDAQPDWLKIGLRGVTISRWEQCPECDYVNREHRVLRPRLICGWLWSNTPPE